MMSASGKSSNRHYEEARGYHGSGHGIYAAMGDSQYRQEQKTKHERGEDHNHDRCPLCP